MVWKPRFPQLYNIEIYLNNISILYIMPVSEAQKRATANYRLRLKGTEKGELLLEKCRGYARKSFNRLYSENAEFRITHLAQCNSRAYYLNDKDQFLRSIRKLYQ